METCYTVLNFTLGGFLFQSKMKFPRGSRFSLDGGKFHKMEQVILSSTEIVRCGKFHRYINDHGAEKSFITLGLFYIYMCIER